MQEQSTTQSLSQVLAQRFNKQTAVASIEEPGVSKLPTTSSIELPESVSCLITGNEYWKRAKSNRYRMLIRQGHLHKLLALVEESKLKKNPANWFATVCSKQNWDRTLDFLAKLQEVEQKASEVASRLGCQASGFIYKQIWKGVNVIRWAIAAQEIGREPIKLFAWYCLHEKELADSV